MIVFISYNQIIFLQQSNLKIRNKTRKNKQLLFAIMKIIMRKFIYDLLSGMLNHNVFKNVNRVTIFLFVDSRLLHPRFEKY
jgi:hypothetical protein